MCCCGVSFKASLRGWAGGPHCMLRASLCSLPPMRTTAALTLHCCAAPACARLQSTGARSARRPCGPRLPGRETSWRRIGRRWRSQRRQRPRRRVPAAAAGRRGRQASSRRRGRGLRCQRRTRPCMGARRRHGERGRGWCGGGRELRTSGGEARAADCRHAGGRPSRGRAVGRRRRERVSCTACSITR